jgi:hypothetical protein
VAALAVVCALFIRPMRRTAPTPTLAADLA